MTELDQGKELIEACWRYLVLGLVQGATEFLPISSTAHLKVLPLILGWEDPGVSISAVIQLGSIFAVLTYFRKDLRQVLKAIASGIRQGRWREPYAQLGVAITLGTLPILLAGMAVKFFWPTFENSPLRSIPSIALISIGMAILLGWAEKTGDQIKSLGKINGKDGLIIGLGQMLALLPGVSRSGITLTTSLIHGFKRTDAARLSFLLGIPAICIAGLSELQNAFHEEITIVFLPLLVGISSAAIVSWLAIDWLIKYLQTNSTKIFITYRLVFGVGLLIWWFHFL